MLVCWTWILAIHATLLLPIPNKLLKRNNVQIMQDLVVHEAMRDITIFVPYLCDHNSDILGDLIYVE